MKPHFYLIILLLICSCGNERILQLPEINHANITEVHDVSAAYLFYDETKAESIELNRKNLISTTNWLINVDKRLTLAQAIPKIKFLQEKKRNAEMHKNEDAKNYYTCHDTSIQNLGFLEFTNVVYVETPSEFNSNTSKPFVQELNIDFKNEEEVYINQTKTSASEFVTVLKERISLASNALFRITLNLDKSNSFQNYITLKKSIEPFLNDFVTLNTHEFIY